MSIFSNLFGKNKGKTINCPYCQLVFEKIPTRKRKCPNCKNTIYVLKDKKGVKLLTEKDKPLVDAYYKEKKVLKSLYLTGASEKQYENYKSDYYKKLGDKANYDDFIWSFYNYLIDELVKQDDFFHAKHVYLSMADIVRDKPDQYIKMQRAANRMNLYELKYNPGLECKYVQISPAGVPCKSCQTLAWGDPPKLKQISIEQALKEEPLPNINCTNEHGCNCMYIEGDNENNEDIF